MASATASTPSPSRRDTPWTSTTRSSPEWRRRIADWPAVDAEHRRHPARRAGLGREGGARDVGAELVLVAAIDAVGAHDHAMARVRIDHPHPQAGLLPGDAEEVPGRRVRQDGFDGDRGGARDDPVPPGEQLVERPIEVLGRRPPMSDSGIQTVSTAITSPLPSPKPREADDPFTDLDLVPGGEPGVRDDRPEVEQPAARDEAALAHVLREGRQAQEADQRSRDDVRPGSVPALDEPIGDQRIRRPPDRHPGHAPAERSALARSAGDRRRARRARRRACVHARGCRSSTLPSRPRAESRGPRRSAQRPGRPLSGRPVRPWRIRRPTVSICETT